jgi:hypothetical protein
MRRIQSIPTPSNEVMLKECITTDTPVLLDRFVDTWPCGRRWTFDYIGSRVKTVKISRPSGDGIYRYHEFDRIPFADFAETLTTSRDVYMGLDPIYRSNKEPHTPEDLKALADEMDVPGFIPQKDLRFANLWIGPGGNKTLLHYDPWHGLLIVLKGRKRFALFDSRQTSRMYGYSVFDLKSVFEHKVLDSRINPANIDLRAYPSLAEAEGIQGFIEEGQALFIPGGFWHYIESEDLNVAVNFFWHKKNLAAHLRRPLIEYRAKRAMIVAVGETIRFTRTHILPKRESRTAA